QEVRPPPAAQLAVRGDVWSNLAHAAAVASIEERRAIRADSLHVHRIRIERSDVAPELLPDPQEADEAEHQTADHHEADAKISTVPLHQAATRKPSSSHCHTASANCSRMPSLRCVAISSVSDCTRHSDINRRISL